MSCLLPTTPSLSNHSAYSMMMTMMTMMSIVKSMGGSKVNTSMYISPYDCHADAASDITPKRHHTRSGQRFNFSSSNESLVEAYAYKKVLGNSRRLERQSSSESKEQQSQKGKVASFRFDIDIVSSLCVRCRISISEEPPEKTSPNDHRL